jgi:paraquat-inducible protein A
MRPPVLERKPVLQKARPPSRSPVTTIAIYSVVLIYMAAAALCAWKVIAHTEASTKAIEQILLTYNLKNEGAKTLESYKKEHPFLGFFLSSPVKHQLELPSAAKADDALYSGVEDLLKTVRHESSVAAWWSWSLLILSLFYVVTVISLTRSFTSRPVIVSLTTVCIVFFFIGILAPAMVVWTAPVIPMETGNLQYVVQHQVRGIAEIIWELIKAGHWIIGGFLLLFSIVTPLTKASLTFWATASRSPKVNRWIANFLHSIGKWSMADVFVAAILLALYALKFQQATKSIPCLGLYYFIGYCLLSMTTTELMSHSEVLDADTEKKSRGKLGLTMIAGLFVMVFCFGSASSLYTYEQYTENTKEKIEAAGSPGKLDNADLVLPGHKK